MRKERLYRTLEYSLLVMQLNVNYRRKVGTKLMKVQGHTWLDNVPDYIRLIGDYLDPTSGLRGRLWWLSAFIAYGLLAGSLVDAGVWNFGQLLQGVSWLLTGFIGCIIIGILRYLDRRFDRTPVASLIGTDNRNRQR